MTDNLPANPEPISDETLAAELSRHVTDCMAEWSNNFSLTTGNPITVGSGSTLADLQWSGGTGYSCS